MEPVWAIGLMTGTVLDGMIDIAMVRTDLAPAGNTVEVEIYGQKYPATTHSMPFWDAKNERLRA